MNIVYYKDDSERLPHLVHYTLDNGDYILGLTEDPSTEQGWTTPKDVVMFFEGEEKILKQQQLTDKLK